MIRRLRKRWEITKLIVDMYAWLYAAKHKPFVPLLCVGQPCPPLIELGIHCIERINSGGILIFTLIIYIFEPNSQ